MPTNPVDPEAPKVPLDPNLQAMTGAQIGNPPIVTEQTGEAEEEGNVEAGAENAPPEDAGAGEKGIA